MKGNAVQTTDYRLWSRLEEEAIRTLSCSMQGRRITFWNAMPHDSESTFRRLKESFFLMVIGTTRADSLRLLVPLFLPVAVARFQIRPSGNVSSARTNATVRKHPSD